MISISLGTFFLKGTQTEPLTPCDPFCKDVSEWCGCAQTLPNGSSGQEQHETCSYCRLEYYPASEDQICGRSEKVDPRSAGKPGPRRWTVFWQHPCHRENADTSLKIRTKRIARQMLYL